MRESRSRNDALIPFGWIERLVTWFGLMTFVLDDAITGADFVKRHKTKEMVEDWRREMRGE